MTTTFPEYKGRKPRPPRNPLIAIHAIGEHAMAIALLDLREIDAKWCLDFDADTPAVTAALMQCPNSESWIAPYEAHLSANSLAPISWSAPTAAASNNPLLVIEQMRGRVLRYQEQLHQLDEKSTRCVCVLRPQINKHLNQLQDYSDVVHFALRGHPDAKGWQHERDEVRGMRKGVEEIVDPGAGDPRFLLMLHEFSQALVVLKREGNTLSQVLRDAWDGRERLETLTKHAPTKASNACISIIAHITIEELRAKLDETAMANGFANRFLFACVRRSKLLPFGGALAAEVAQRLGEQTKEAIIAAQLTTGVTMNAPAQALWREVYPELARGGDGLLAHITSRAEAQTVRLALLYTLLDRAEAIDAVHLEAALAVWRYCEASARYIFGDLLGDPAADTILQTLRRRKPAGMAKREIIDLFGRNLRAAAINAALGLLERTGKVRCEPQPSGGGRPREMWFAK